MLISLDGNTNVYRCEPGVVLGEVLDRIRDHLGQNRRVVERVLLDGEEMTPEREQGMRRGLVDLWEVCAIHTAPQSVLLGSLVFGAYQAAGQLREATARTTDMLASDPPEGLGLVDLLVTEARVAQEALSDVLRLAERAGGPVKQEQGTLRLILRELDALLRRVEDIREQADAPGTARLLRNELDPLLARVAQFCQGFREFVPAAPTPPPSDTHSTSSWPIPSIIGEETIRLTRRSDRPSSSISPADPRG